MSFSKTKGFSPKDICVLFQTVHAHVQPGGHTNKFGSCPCFFSLSFKLLSARPSLKLLLDFRAASFLSALPSSRFTLLTPILYHPLPLFSLLSTMLSRTPCMCCLVCLCSQIADLRASDLCSQIADLKNAFKLRCNLRHLFPQIDDLPQFKHEYVGLLCSQTAYALPHALHRNFAIREQPRPLCIDVFASVVLSSSKVP